VKYYKLGVGSKSKYHVTLGYDTVLSRLTLFKAGKEFSFDEEYEYLDNLEDEEGETCFALLEFERAVIADKLALVIGSKLDLDVHTANCRIAFHGRLLEGIPDKNYATTVLPRLKVFKRKTKMGNVQRIPNDHELIADSIFKKETKMMMFTNLKVQLSTGESGLIEGSFGQSGKVKVRVPDGIKPQTMVLLTNKKFKQSNSDGVKIILNFKKYIFDKEKRIVQQ
jgi:selenocysteine-specific elongation factor